MAKSGYEVLKVLTLWHSYDIQHPIGFLLKNLLNGSITGCTFREAWELVNEYGSNNSKAIVNIKRLGNGTNFTSYTMSALDGLPSFDDEYWFEDLYCSKIGENAVMTEELMRQIKRVGETTGCLHS